jgi:eukaryotic-like serine/threonine-protein kinase
MIQIDWSTVKETLADALEVAREERDAFLDSRCGRDTTLRSTVERLLRGHDSASGFLDESGSLASPAGLPPPERVGPYLLHERLGEGGFGVVYRATQMQPFQREVALKLLKSQANAGAVAARFRAERDALARMDQEDICRVLDAGLTDDGRPYVVMDLVRGRSITAHCTELRLTLRARAALVARAARAVHHAHQRAVIHCDVKPSNILVSVEGDATRLRLIDFGIARALGETESADYPRWEIAGTPRYMSPERRTASREADVRSDVYSLGAVLAELTRDAASASLIDGRLLHSDLDAIAAMATAEEPSGRYESAAAFAEDIAGALRGDSIRAVEENAWATFRRMVRRNRVASSLVAVAAFALITGAGLAFKGRTDALVARDAAAREARRAELVSVFLLDDMLGSLDPNITRGRDVSVYELLSRVDERMATSLADDPLLLADVAGMLGVAYRHVGRDPDAIRAFETAIATREQVEPPAPEDVLGWRVELAEAMFGDPVRHGEAMGLRARNAADAIEALGPWHPISMEARLQHTPMSVDWTAKTAEIEEIVERATALGPPGMSLAEDAMRKLALIYGETERVPESIALLEKLVASTEARLGSGHSETAVARRSLADGLMKNGDTERAIALYDEAVRATRELFPAKHPALIGLLSTVAIKKSVMGRPEEALPLIEEVVAVTLELNGQESVQHVNARLMQGQVLVTLGDHAEGEAIVESVLPQLQAQWGSRSAKVGAALVTLARAKAELGKHEGALAAATDAAFCALPTTETGFAALELRCRALIELDRSEEVPALVAAALEAVPAGAPESAIARITQLQADLIRR